MTARGFRVIGARRATVALAIALALSWAVSLELHPWADESVGDLATRRAFAERMLAGELPYRDFAFEYPPLSAPVLALAGLAGSETDAFRLGIAAVTFVAALALLVLVRAIARRTGGSETLAMLAIAAAPLLIGAVIRLHVDIVAAALALGGMLAILRGRPAAGLAVVGAGAMTKGFPLVVAPVALAWISSWYGARSALRAGGAFVATLAALAALAALLSPQGAADALIYQLDRPVQVESAGATILWVADLLGAERPSSFDSHGSVALDHAIAAPVQLACTAALAGAIATLAAIAARSVRRRSPGARPGPVDAVAGRALVLASSAALIAAVALGPVLSPQFLTWTLPLLALAIAWRMRVLAASIAAACVLTLVEFPDRYFDLVAGDPAAIVIVGVRNAALLAAVALAIRGPTARSSRAAGDGTAARRTPPGESGWTPWRTRGVLGRTTTPR